MRMFAKVPHLTHISRCLSCRDAIHRPHHVLHVSYKQGRKIYTKCVFSRPTSPMLRCYANHSSNVFTFNTDMDILRKRISCNEAADESSSNVVPVGIIAPEKKDGHNIKIVIVPLDLKKQSTDALAKTLIALEELRTHAHEIDAFTNKMIDDYHHDTETGAVKEKEQGQMTVPVKHIDDAIGGQTVQTADERRQAFAEMGSLPKADVVPMIPNPITTPNLPKNPNTKPVNPNNVPNQTPQTQPNVMPLGDPQRTQISAKHEKDYLNTDLLTIEAPPGLNKHLNELAISSMQLSFEMNMTDVRDAILYGENVNKKTQPTLGEDAIVSFGTIVEAAPQHEPEQTVPLQFNVLISGTVHLDVDKLEVDQFTEKNYPIYQDSVTSVAANICGTALQTNLALFSDTPVQSFESTPDQLNTTKAQMDLQNKQPAIEAKDGCKHPIIKPKRKCKKPPCKLDDPCHEDKCKPPKQKPSKASAENALDVTASAKKGASGSRSKFEPTSGSGGKFNTYSTKAGPASPSSFYKPKRFVCSTCISSPMLPRFKIYATRIHRRYSGKSLLLNSTRGYGKDNKSKCASIGGGTDRPQVDKKAPKGLRTDCPEPGSKSGETTCPPKTIVRDTSCANVKFPRKKCPKDEVERKDRRRPKPPQKKLPPICSVYNKKKGDKGAKAKK